MKFVIGPSRLKKLINVVRVVRVVCKKVLETRFVFKISSESKGEEE